MLTYKGKTGQRVGWLYWMLSLVRELLETYKWSLQWKAAARQSRCWKYVQIWEECQWDWEHLLFLANLWKRHFSTFLFSSLWLHNLAVLNGILAPIQKQLIQLRYLDSRFKGKIWWNFGLLHTTKNGLVCNQIFFKKQFHCTEKRNEARLKCSCLRAICACRCNHKLSSDGLC